VPDQVSVNTVASGGQFSLIGASRHPTPRDM